MKEFFCFLLSPYDKPMVEGWRSKARFTLNSLGVLFVLLLANAALQMLYIYFTGSKSHLETWQAYDNGLASIAKEIGPSFLLFYGCIIGPFMEEAAFRLPFSFKRGHVLVGLPILVLLISFVLGNWYLFVGVVILMGSVAFFVHQKITQEQLDALKKKHGKTLLHSVALLFALLHIGNYGEFSITHLGSYFFSIGSILISAYFFYYVRLRAGFLYGFVLHAAMNSFMLSEFFHN